jgi:hypothetical protein
MIEIQSSNDATMTHPRQLLSGISSGRVDLSNLFIIPSSQASHPLSQPSLNFLESLTGFDPAFDIKPSIILGEDYRSVIFSI